MSFTFVHTADWQLGKAFGSMPADVAAALTEARMGAIDRLAALAARAGAAHVLVAGDVFDTATPSLKTVRQAMARIDRRRELTWHLIPGNHDAHRPGGLWERLMADAPPDNLRVHMKAEPAEIDLDVWLLPAPLMGRASSLDPTRSFDTVGTPAGALRIGLAHGSVQGFGSNGEAAINIAPERAEAARLDYLALGDWHGVKQVNARTWYSGTPEPDRFTGNGPGHALIVRLSGPGAVARVEKAPTAQFVWLRRELELRGPEDLEALQSVIGAAATQPSDVLLQLQLAGRVTAASRQAITRRLQTLEASVRHLDLDLSRLAVSVSSGDLEPLGGVGELRQVGERLVGLRSAEASEALGLLLDLAAQVGCGRQ